MNFQMKRREFGLLYFGLKSLKKKGMWYRKKWLKSVRNISDTIETNFEKNRENIVEDLEKIKEKH